MRAFRTIALGLLLLVGAAFGAGVVAPSVTHAADEPAASTASSEPENKNLWDSIWGCASDLGTCALESTLIPVGGIAFVFLAIANAILAFAIGIFDFAVGIFVFQFALYFGNSPGMLLGWSMLRDIGNIILVFGFVSIGIETILNVGHYSVGKTLPRLIIFAVLLNFSLFAAEAVIDSANAVASAIFQQAYSCGSAEACTGASITGDIMNLTGLSSIFAAAQEFADFFGNTNKLQRIIAYVLSTVFVVVTAAVLLFGAFMLISRAITLAFLMITSPIGFAGMAIPSLNKMANGWWKSLIDNALFAPAFLLLMFVSLQITRGVAGALTPSGGQMPNIIDVLFNASKTGDFGGALIFILVVGFMFGALLAAKQFGLAGADWAVKSAGNAIGYGTAGMWARAGRFTLGRPLNRLATNVRASRFGNTLAGDILAKGLDVGATKSFDMRGAKGNIKIAGVSLGKTGDFGKEGRRGELKKIAEKAGKDAELREKAFKAKDAPLKADVDALAKQEATERAFAFQLRKDADEARSQAERAADPATRDAFTARANQLEREARGHDRTAEERKAEKESLERDLKAQKMSRLDEGEQALQKYRAAGGAAADRERERTSEGEAYRAAQREATAEVERLTATIRDLERALADGGMDAATRAETERQRNEAMADRNAATRRLDDANTALERLRTGADAFSKSMEKIRKAEQEEAKKMLDAKYAMVQVADRLEKAARTFERAGVVTRPLTDSLRTMAGGIRSDAGQSKEAKLAHELQHMLEHAAHGAEHGEDHGDDHAGGGGGGHGGGGHAGGGGGHGGGGGRGGGGGGHGPAH